MELAPVHARRDGRRRLTWRAVEIAAILIAVWVALVAVVPAVLGLEPVVADESDRGLRAGTLVLTRDVPLDDVSVGDLVMAADGVRRVAGVGPRSVRLEDSARLDRARATIVRKAVVVVPFAGKWAALVLFAMLVAVTVTWRLPHRVHRACTHRARRVATLVG